MGQISRILFADILDIKEGFQVFKVYFHHSRNIQKCEICFLFFFCKISLFHSRKIQFLKGVSPRFLVKEGRFLLSLFLGQISLNCLFLDILDRKEGLKDYKFVFFSQSRKILIFLRRGNRPWFWSKSPNSFLVLSQPVFQYKF